MPAPRGGQRRPVTALFADIVGSTAMAERLDAEEWSDIVGEGVRRMAAVVARYDGHVDQVLGDGVLAFFGLRVAHEDDPQRAVRAGLEIVQEMRRYSDETEQEHGLRLPVRVGINSGPVVVRELGDSAGRTEVTALGDAVNVAARMQAEARPDTVLVTAATHAFVAGSTASRHIGAIALKGKSEAVDAFEIERWTGTMARPRGIPGLMSPMVGRDAQLAALIELLPAVRAGRGRAAIVLGEPGIGKSRLLAEFRRLAGTEPSPLAWHEARCLSYGRSLPYHLASGIARSILGLPAPELGIDTPPDLDDPDGAERPAGDRRSVDDPYLAHLLALHVSADASRDIAMLDPTVLQGRYAEAIRGVIADTAGGRPVAIVCEDVHWADPASVDLIGRLLPHLQDLPVLLLVAARPDRDSAGWSLVTAARDRYGDVLVDLRLTALSMADSRALVAGLLEIESLPSTTRDYILERADGNPFFMEEVIRMLVDRGAIERQDGRWVATRTVESGEIPETLHGLLLARIDRLDPEAREVLRVASVIGRRFPISVLARAMSSAGVGALAPSLGTLEGAGMIELVQTNPDLEYLFRHVLIQEAAYESLLRQDRRRLHAVVADSMEELFGDRLDELAGVVAMHLDAAGESARAIDYFVRAGRFALSRFAAHEAKEAFVRARALIPDGDVDPETRRLRAEVDLGTVHAGITFTPGDEDLAILGRARRDAEALDDAALLTRVFLLIAVIRTAQGDQYATSPELREAIDRGIASADRSGDAAHRTEALAILGEARYGSADYEDAIPLLDEAASRFEADGRTARASLARGTLGLANARLGRLDKADAELARAERLAHDSADPTALLDTDLYRAIVEALHGRPEIAIEFAVRAADAADQVDNKACALVARSVIGEQRLLLGQPEAAIGVLEESADLAAYCNLAPTRVEFTRALLDSARAQCRGPVMVPDRLERALELAQVSGDRLAEGEVLRQRARDRLRCGSVEAALADFGAAETVFRTLGARPDLAQTLDEHAAASAAAGRQDEAAKISAEAASVRAAMGSPGINRRDRATR